MPNQLIKERFYLFGLTGILEGLTIVKRLKELLPWFDSTEEKAKVDAELLEEEREFWQTRLEQKEEELEEVQEQLQEYRSKAEDLNAIMMALERKGIDTEALIERYRNEFKIMLVYPGHQQDPDGKTDKFVKNELEQHYGAVDLGGGLKLIPPAQVPEWIETGDDINQWLQEEIYPSPDYRTVISFAAVLDLEEIFWHTDYDDEQQFYKTIDQRLTPEQLYKSTEEFFESVEAYDISLIEIVEEMNIGYFASKILPREPAERIYNDLDEIQEELDNPSLRKLADEEITSELSEALEDYTDRPEEVAEMIVDQAQFWNSKRNEHTVMPTQPENPA